MPQGAGARHPFARLAAGYARLVTRLRLVVVLGWLVLVAIATMALPKASGGNHLGDLLPKNSPAIAATERSLHSFDIPLTTGTVVVLHNPAGLATLTTADVVLYALSVDQQLRKLQAPYPEDRVLGALPIIDPLDRTTAVTYLYFAPGASVSTQIRLAHQYADHFRVDPDVRRYVTGLVPAEDAQAGYLSGSLALIEISTLVLVALVVAVTFRSLVAPLLTLGAAGLAFFADQRVLGWLGQVAGVGLPSQLEPLVVALLLGILTDYSVFFLAGYRERLTDPGAAPRQGDGRAAHAWASERSITDNTPIVVVAGLTVAAGCAALYAAPMQLFRAFGPGLAVTVLVGLVTAVALIPALVALLGPRIFWPSDPQRLAARHRRPPTRRVSLVVGWVTTRRSAAIAATGCVVALAIAALPLAGLRLSLSFTGTLPSDDPVRQGTDALTHTYARGITAPTEILVEGDGVTQQRDALARFQDEIASQPGVARALGPADNPLPRAHGVVLANDGRTARVIVVFTSDPLGAQAISDFRGLTDRAPQLAGAAGLRQATLAYAGDTAIASEVSHETTKNLRIILGAAIGVELVLLALYLRALVAPVYLLCCSALTVADALGLTVLVFQYGLGVSGLTFYAPFATAVLLLALGSDYNVFGIGSIWAEAERRPLVAAIRKALPRSTRAITTAGITLAGSFALVGIIPLLTFAEVAFTMTVGLLIDTFLVRSVLTPSLLTLVGPVSGWPGRRLRRTASAAGADALDEPDEPAEPAAVRMPPRPRSRPSRQNRHMRLPLPPLPGRRWRTALRISLVIVGLALLAWGLDWLSRIGAQSVVARSIQSAERLDKRPSVQVRGWFFLPQVITGHYDEVDVRVEGLRSGPLRLASVSARLYGVHVSLHDVITSSVSTVPVDRTQETAQLTYPDLNAYLAAQGDPIIVADGPPGQLTVTGHVTILDHPLAVSADAKVAPVPGYLDVTPTQLKTGVGPLDTATRLLLGQRLTFAIPTAPLPFGQQVSAIQPGPQALTVQAAGVDIVAARPQPR